jgi:putative NADPH-quinone reductase
MPVSIILANPNPNSFCHAIAQRVIRTLESIGKPFYFHDLCAEGFDPLLPSAEIPRNGALPFAIARHCDEIADAEGVVIVHPNWWGMPPAILTGWVDRVIRPGVAYEFLEGDQGEGVPHGLLKARFALVFNTGNTAIEREMRVFGDPLERIWKDCVFGLCGVTRFRRRLYETIVTSTPEQRRKWLCEVGEIVLEEFKR